MPQPPNARANRNSAVALFTSRARVTRDYAYYIENRLRERYRLEGVPAIIDFVERDERANHSDGRSQNRRRQAR